MLVREPPRRPRFGATYEKLRYDAPISVRDPATGKYSSLRYEDGWKPELHDVVVWLPERGAVRLLARLELHPVLGRPEQHRRLLRMGRDHLAAAGRRRLRRAADGQGAALRPGRDRRIDRRPGFTCAGRISRPTSSTRSGATQAVEDYYFYPDGFGTRVLNLKADPKNDYELSEFIILTPAGRLSVRRLARRPGRCPVPRRPQARIPIPEPDRCRPGGAASRQERRAGDLPPAVRQGRGARRRSTSIRTRPSCRRSSSAPFSDGGQMVTPCYWGSHWPLARGNSTGSKIDDRIAVHPVPQQRDELGRHAGRRRCDRPSSSRSTPWADRGR